MKDKQPQTCYVPTELADYTISDKYDMVCCNAEKLNSVYIHTPEELEALKAKWMREVIGLIKECELLIPIERFFNEDGTHITKKQYGLILLEILEKQLEEKIPITTTNKH